MKKQAGFTLIELIVVIVILGILAATALPKFVGLDVDARNAAAQGFAGGYASASSMNYAKCRVGGTPCTVINTPALACATATYTTLMQSPLDTTNYTLAAAATPGTCAAAGDPLSCTITPVGTGATAATAIVTCTAAAP